MEKLNFKSKILIDDFAFFQSVVDEEFNQRMKYIIGSFRAAGASYGIVAEEDPVSNTDSTKPLAVVAGSTTFTVDITAGAIVTEKGEWAIQDAQTSLALADNTEGVVNLVIAEFTLVDTDNRPSLFDEQLIPAKQIRGTVLSIATLQDYNNPSLFSSDRRQNTVVLAAVTVFADANSVLQSDVDTSRNIYSFIRPWFSPVDIEHRGKLGNGLATDDNPHGLAFSDLTTGTLSLYQQLLSFGQVISKDKFERNVPGCLQTDVFLAASVKTDTTGDITGTVGALYVTTSHYPIQLAAAYDTNVVQNKFAARIVKGKNIIAFSEHDVAIDVTVKYFFSKALEPPTALVNNTLTVLLPNDSEVLIAQGRELSSIDNPNINFDNSGPIPRDFRVFLNSDGDLIENSRIIQPAIRLNVIVDPLIFDVTLITDSKIIVGLTRANVASTIVLRLVGKDINGDPLQEDITFNPANWSDTSIPASAENVNQFQQTTNLFNEVTSIEVVSRSGDGSNSTIIVYADASLGLYEALPVMDVFWDGLSAQRVSDIRKIVPYLNEVPRTTLEESPVHTAFLLDTIGTFAYSSASHVVLAEDFVVPSNIDLICDDSPIVQGTGEITFVVASGVLLLSDSDTITIASGKVLTAKTAGADPELGEFDIAPLSLSTTIANAVVAINDGVFDSTVTGVGTATGIDLTASTDEVNFEITKTESVVGSILITGFKNGFKNEVGLIRDSFVHGLDSGAPGGTPELVANKYRTNAIALAETTVVTLVIVGYGVQRPDLITVKPTYVSRPDVWQAAVAATPTVVPNVWTVTFSDPVAKLSLEIFGKLNGISVYAIVP